MFIYFEENEKKKNQDSLHKRQRKQTRKAYLRAHLKEPMKSNEMLINYILTAVQIKSQSKIFSKQRVLVDAKSLVVQGKWMQASL